MNNQELLLKSCETDDINGIEKSLKSSFLKKSAEINHQYNSMTPLMIASQNGKLEVVKYLLEKGANIELVDRNKDTAFIIALNNHHFAVAELLLSKGANINSTFRNATAPIIYHFFNNKETEIVNFLLKWNVNLNFKFELTGKTLLESSLKQNSFDLSKFLIINGADLNIRNKNSRTPLMLAMIMRVYYEPDKKKSLELIDLLLSNGADINAEDDEGNTALFFSFRRDDSKDGNGGRAVCIQHTRKLLENGAIITHRNKKNETILHWAFDNYSEKIEEGKFKEEEYICLIKELLNSGFDLLGEQIDYYFDTDETLKPFPKTTLGKCLLEKLSIYCKNLYIYKLLGEANDSNYEFLINSGYYFKTEY